MKYDRIILTDQVIFKQRSLTLNPKISARAEEFAIEEGWGMNIDEMGYGATFSLCRKLDLACKADKVDGWVQKFNKK